MKKAYRSPEVVFQDPSYSTKAKMADLDTLSKHVDSSLGVKLAELQSGKVALSQLKPVKEASIARCESHTEQVAHHQTRQ